MQKAKNNIWGEIVGFKEKSCPGQWLWELNECLKAEPAPAWHWGREPQRTQRWARALPSHFTRCLGAQPPQLLAQKARTGDLVAVFITQSVWQRREAVLLSFLGEVLLSVSFPSCYLSLTNTNTKHASVRQRSADCTTLSCSLLFKQRANIAAECCIP